MAMNLSVTFNGISCRVKFDRYWSNGRVALVLVNEETIPNSNVAVATVNLPYKSMSADEVAIKNYSENSGILQVLMDAEIVEAPTAMEPSGFVYIPICKLTKEAMNYLLKHLEKTKL